MATSLITRQRVPTYLNGNSANYYVSPSQSNFQSVRHLLYSLTTGTDDILSKIITTITWAIYENEAEAKSTATAITTTTSFSLTDLFAEIERHLISKKKNLTVVYNSPSSLYGYLNLFDCIYSKIIYYQATQFRTPESSLSPLLLHQYYQKAFDCIVNLGVEPVRPYNYYNLTSHQQTLPYVKACNALVRYGPSILQKMARLLYRRLSRRVAHRKKHAVHLISNWWFALITSPYTRVGQRYIQTQLASQFYNK